MSDNEFEPYSKTIANTTQFMSIILAGYIDIGNTKYLYFAMITVLYLAIIHANAMLIGVIYLERTLHEPMYFFLCSLFVNELYGSTALFPSLLVNIISKTHEVSLAYCYIQMFCLYTYGNLEFCNLAIMSYDRYLSICYPLQYNTIMTSNRVCVLILLVWLYSFIKYSINLSLHLHLQLCGNIIEKVWCDNYLFVKLACSNTTVNNFYGLFTTSLSVAVPLVLIFYSYIKILQICLNSSKETKQKAINTCIPHLASLLNYSLGCSFEVLSSRFNKIHMPAMLRIFISVYFLMCPPLFNPIMYGIRMNKIRDVCKKIVYPVK